MSTLYTVEVNEAVFLARLEYEDAGNAVSAAYRAFMSDPSDKVHDALAAAMERRRTAHRDVLAARDAQARTAEEEAWPTCDECGKELIEQVMIGSKTLLYEECYAKRGMR